MTLTTADRIDRALAEVREVRDIIESCDYPPKYVKPALKRAETHLTVLQDQAKHYEIG